MLELYSPRIRFGTCKVRPSESTVELNSCGHTTAFYLGKHDLLTVYLGKLAFLSVTDFPWVTYLGKILSSGSWICLENNRVSLDSYLKAIAREK